MTYHSLCQLRSEDKDDFMKVLKDMGARSKVFRFKVHCSQVVKLSSQLLTKKSTKKLWSSSSKAVLCEEKCFESPFILLLISGISTK